jgi:hypothetical protein
VVSDTTIFDGKKLGLNIWDTFPHLNVYQFYYLKTSHALRFDVPAYVRLGVVAETTLIPKGDMGRVAPCSYAIRTGDEDI